ncbi:MAG: hypothetical protein U9N61_05415 [Euryarchaeota archaeon]|nr:hypothetical protein [Euryarchaeota archaeon]
MDDIGPALFGTALLTFISLYPFYLKKYRRHKYKGLWKGMGEMTGSPARAIAYPIGFLIGCLIYIMVTS